MNGVDDGCGPLFSLYVAAREADIAGIRATWDASGESLTELRVDVRDRIAAAVERGDTATVEALVAEELFEDAEAPTLDGPVATTLGGLLWAFGYVASFVLFFRARSRERVVARLRWAYRTVGVDIRHTETADGVARTTFRCPYRNLGSDRVGRRRVCHDVLDRVDDGYVTFLDRRRDLDYQRPRACASSDCCYSELSGR